MSERVIYLVRHAEVEKAGRFHGSSDVALSARGRRQAERWAERAIRWRADRLAGSDLLRVRQTARPFARRSGLELETDPRLRECHFGDWEGLTWDEVECRNPRLAAEYVKDWVAKSAPKGESINDMRRRVLEAWADLELRNWRRLVMVGHAGTNLLLLGHFLGMPPENLFRIRQGYTAVAEVGLSEGTPQLRSLDGGAEAKRESSRGDAETRRRGR